MQGMAAGTATLHEKEEVDRQAEGLGPCAQKGTSSARRGVLDEP